MWDIELILFLGHPAKQDSAQIQCCNSQTAVSVTKLVNLALDFYYAVSLSLGNTAAGHLYFKSSWKLLI
ncbi:MAG: hypothetical protein CL400_03390 [Acidiferrobacteraceae bacterium]|nr:hypothetical protein [Acidiferrobacteraceae bacterium]